MRLVSDHAMVTVPATVAGLGPGGSSVALALSAHDKVSLRATAGASRIFVQDQEETAQAHSVGNLIVESLKRGLEYAGAPLVGVELRCQNGIARDRGLGAKTAGILTGLAGAQAFLGGPKVLPIAAIVELAQDMGATSERLGAALRGGAAIVWGDRADEVVSLKPPPLIAPVVFTPEYTSPNQGDPLGVNQVISVGAAQKNSAGSALLGVALSGLDVCQNEADFLRLLFHSTEDAIYLEQSRHRVPASVALVEWLRGKGYPAVLSGLGPAVVNLTPVESGLVESAKRSGWQVASVPVGSQGVTVSCSGVARQLLTA